jgi:hypothetical protein
MISCLFPVSCLSVLTQSWRSKGSGFNSSLSRKKILIHWENPAPVGHQPFLIIIFVSILFIVLCVCQSFYLWFLLEVFHIYWHNHSVNQANLEVLFFSCSATLLYVSNACLCVSLCVFKKIFFAQVQMLPWWLSASKNAVTSTWLCRLPLLSKLVGVLLLCSSNLMIPIDLPFYCVFLGCA